MFFHERIEEMIKVDAKFGANHFWERQNDRQCNVFFLQDDFVLKMLVFQILRLLELSK